ncbi:MAG: phage holin family protein [Candidatus Binataceae bacterium]
MNPHHEEPVRRQPPGDITWAELAERVIGDLTHVIRVEIELFRNSLTPIFSDLTDRVVAGLIAGFVMLAGGVTLLAALIMLLHQWLPWWQALAISGAAAILAGYILTRFATRSASHHESHDTGGL